MIRQKAALLCALLKLVRANGWVNNPWQTSIPEPADDPFYTTVPKNLADFKPGDVIEYRDVGLAMFQQVQFAKQLKYRSENSRGEPVYGITTVIVPRYSELDKVVSYQYFEDAACLKCAPSHQLLSEQKSAGIAAIAKDIQPILDYGWILNFPDHEGMNSSFMGGPLAGKLVLDSLRALHNAQYLFGLKDKYEQALWGYSGGSHATGHAAEMQAKYAPDVNIKFMAMGGVIANANGSMFSTKGGPFAGFLVSAIAGLASEYPSMWDAIDANIKPAKLNDLNKVFKMCMSEELLHYAFVDPLKDWFSTDRIFDHPTFKRILNKVSLGHTVPQIPMYLFHADLDEIQPIRYVDQLVDFYCQGGANVEYYRARANGHITLMGSMGNQVAMRINEAFRNNLPKGCIRH